jgi:diacylglycerol kinase family enzyme
MVFENVSVGAINKEILGLELPSVQCASDNLSKECYGVPKPEHRSIAVIYNPAGGSFHQSDLDEFTRACHSGGADIVTIPTDHVPNSASSKAIAAADSKKYDTIVSWGGDGTFSGVENGLHLCLDEGKTVPPVAVYPGGTENVFSKTMHSPHDPDQFAEMVLSPERTVKNVDVMKISYTDQNGKSQKQDIIAEVGVGPLATAIDKASSPLKKVLGPGYLTLYFLKAVLQPHPKRFEIDTAGDDARSLARPVLSW